MAAPTESKHWPRWTKAAFWKSADAVKGTTPVYFEGDERTTRLDSNFAEIRLTGPDVWEPAKDCFRLQVIYNILINSKEDTRDLYRPDRLIGQFYGAFKNTITVNRVGNGPDDDQSFLGCYQLISDLDTNQFGIVDRTMRAIQSTIEGTYELVLDLT